MSMLNQAWRRVYETVRGTVRRWLGIPSPTYETQRAWNKAQGRKNRGQS